MSLRTLLTAIVLCGLLAASAADPVLGVWKLNLSRSRYNPGPAPRSQTRTYVQTANGIQVTIRSIDTTGRSSTIEFPEKYDGKDYAVQGSDVADALAMVRINDYMAEASMKHGGMVVATARRLITDEGKTLVISFKQLSSDHPVDNELVYERQ